ncbi:MAG: ribosome biogenesis GTP-binding protein YihA/YsxC [Erysipelotrichaceae bacterium]|nr:ribosome biogenesis GTP-binding protein YihA/YsxC [Erysipelotrichaceae bacterium]
MINFRNAKFIKSAPTYEESPKDNILDEILIVGRSNVGKSSLINALCDNKSLAFTSSKPGHTKLLNFFNIDKRFYLVDAPGYGYSISSRSEIVDFQKLMDGYFSTSKKLKGVVFLLDSRREVNHDDVLLYNFFIEHDIPFILVLTKCDKINQKEKAKITSHLKEIGMVESIKETILVSINDKIAVNKLKSAIEKVLAN